MIAPLGKLATFATLFILPSVVAASHFEDKNDWNMAMRTACKIPVAQSEETLRREASVKWTSAGNDRKLKVKLDPGDMGGCASDDGPRDGAKFWERAEVVQYDRMNNGEKHEISFEAIFFEGFVGKRETFLQIHGWTSQCNAAPILMMQFDWRKMRILTLQSDKGKNARGALSVAAAATPEIENIALTKNNFNIVFDRSQSPNTVEITMNGEQLLPKTPVHVQDCDEPRLKLGIYRPGGANPATSTILFDDIQLKKAMR